MQQRLIRFVVATLVVALGAVGLGAGGSAPAAAAPEHRSASAAAASVDALAGLVTNGPIYDVERVGDTTYVGGDFDYVGERVSSSAVLAADSGLLQGPMTALPDGATAASVTLVDAQPDGAGGYFASWSRNANRSGGWLTHHESNGAIAWSVEVGTEAARMIEVHDTLLLVAGGFTSVGGSPRPGLAALDRVTGTVLSWSPQLPVSGVADATLSGTAVYYKQGTDSTAANDVIRAVNYPSGTMRAFVVDASHPGTVEQVEYHDGLILTNVGAFDEFGTSVPSPCTIFPITVRAGDVIFSGQNAGLTRCDLSTGETSFAPPSLGNAQVTDLSVLGDVLYVATGGAEPGVLALDARTGSTLWEVDSNNSSNRATVVGSTGQVHFWDGAMTAIGLEARSNLAAIDVEGHLSPWNPGPNGTVRTLAVDGAALVAGGEFTTVGGTDRSRLARVDAVTGALDPAWDPVADGLVLAVEVSAGVTYAGGAFTTIDGAPQSRLVALGPDGQVVPGWTTGANSTVTALEPFDATLYVAGVFSSIGGEPRSRLAALDAATGAVTTWNPGADDFVRSIDATADAVYVGGGFLESGGQPRQRVAALDPSTGEATGWDPGVDGEVWEVSVFEDQVYLGGTFTNVGGEERRSLAAVTTAGEVAGWNPAPSGVVYSIVTSGGVVSAAGLFGTAPALRAGERAGARSVAVPSDANQLAFAQYQATEAVKPTVSIVTPVDGVDYTRGATVTADFACADEPGGSGIASCQGTVADGAPIDTSSLRTREFTVTAVDGAGNVTTRTVTYGVVDRTDPTIAMTTPPDGAVFARDQVVVADFTCADEVAGSGLTGCVGDVADGAPIDTSTLGEHEFTVTATDGAGNSTELTHQYAVGDPNDPTISLVTPPDHVQAIRGGGARETVGAVYRTDQVVSADYSCADEAGGSGLASCVGDVADGQPIDTSTPGVHDFTVDAADQAGNTASVTHRYTVADPQPDGAIKAGTGTYAGDGVYNTTGRAQKASASAARGRTITYTVRLQNDAPFADSVRLRGTASSGQYGVTYWLGSTDITAAVVAGTFSTASIPAQQSVAVKVKVKVKSAATVGSSITGKLTATSGADEAHQDAVKFSARRA